MYVDHVYILDKYFDKLPESAKIDDLQPLSNVPRNAKHPWFAYLPVGKTSIHQWCESAGFGRKGTTITESCCGGTSLYKGNLSE